MVDCTHDEPADGGPPGHGAAGGRRLRQARRRRGRRRGAHPRGLTRCCERGGADALRLLRAAHAQNGVLTNLYMDRRVGPEAELPAPHLI